MMNQLQIIDWMKENQHIMDAPESFIGGEINSFNRAGEWDNGLVRAVFINAYDYRTASGSMSVPLIYHLLNKYHADKILAGRSNFVATRREMDIFEEAGCPIFDLDYKKPITDWDVIGFSVCFGMGYFNMVKMMKMCGLPLRSKDRDDSHPLILMGGMAIFNPEPVADFVDVVYVGDGETNLAAFLKLWGERKAQGVAKMDILEEATKTLEGIYVPALYEVKFNERGYETERVALRPGVPLTIKKTVLRDLASVPIFSQQMVHWDGNGMGIGEVLASRGCYWAKCTFCSEGNTQLPYREEPPERIIAGLKDAMRECGTVDVLPGGYGLGDYSSKKTLLRDLLEQVSDRVTLLSLRVDQLADDENWSMMSGTVGNASCSIGVEGVSEKLRRLVNKGVTEEMILTTTRYLIRAGYKKIKYFMIANLPGETVEDLMEFTQTVEKVAKIRDEENFGGEIKWSFTPMTYSEFTALQFCEVNLDGRTLNMAFDKIKEYDLGFRLGSSARRDEIYLSTIIHLGDRRLGDAIEKLVLNDNLIHFGMTRKGSLDLMEGYLKEQNLSFAHFFVQKDMDYIFPWDFIDIGVRKDYLFKEYRNAMQCVVLPGCYQKCEACGACGAEDFKIKKTWKLDSPVVESEIKRIRQKGTVAKLRLKVHFFELYRFATKNAFKFMLRRAAYKAGLPLDKYIIAQSTDKIDIDNWVWGTDYVDYKLTSRIDDVKSWAEKLNRNMVGCKVIDAQILPALEGSLLRTSADLCLFDMPTVKSYSEAKDQIAWFLSQQPIPEAEVAHIRESKSIKEKNAFLKQYKTAVRIKKMSMQGMERVITDLRPCVDNIWSVEVDGSTRLRAMVRDDILPFDVHISLFGGTWRDTAKYPARRIDFLKHAVEEQDDIFTERCDCGRKVEENIIGKQLTEGKCLRCSDNEEPKLWLPADAIVKETPEFAERELQIA